MSSLIAGSESFTLGGSFFAASGRGPGDQSKSRPFWICCFFGKEKPRSFIFFSFAHGTYFDAMKKTLDVWPKISDCLR